MIRDHLLRQKEVLSILRISRTTLYSLRKKGKFPPPRCLNERGDLAWLESEIQDWLDRPARAQP